MMRCCAAAAACSRSLASFSFAARSAASRSNAACCAAACAAIASCSARACHVPEERSVGARGIAPFRAHGTAGRTNWRAVRVPGPGLYIHHRVRRATRDRG